MTREEYWYWFCTIPGFTARKLQNILTYYGSPQEAFRMPEELLRQFPNVREEDTAAWKNSIAEIDSVCREYHELAERGIHFITKEQSGYPQRLLQIYDAPMGLFFRGRLPADHRPSVSIIGARGCTSYGREIAHALGKELAACGVQIVSGMAVGIDGAGQRGALEGGGDSYAVLGSGIDVCYPRENYDLYHDLPEKGGVISEYHPKMAGLPHLFPMRNRIISALSDCIIVVEARRKSGTLITVDQGLEQGKDIFAVPGRIGDPLSEGCNELIRNGAGIVTSTEDILRFLHIESKKLKKITHSSKKALVNEEKIIYSCLGFREKHIEEILGECGMPVSQTAAILLQLELKGWITQPQKNYYRKVR